MTLPSQAIGEAIRGSKPWIRSAAGIAEEQIQPASLDCTLGDRVYRVITSFLPRPDETIEEVLRSRTLYDFELKPGSILERGATYVIPLREEAALPDDLLAVSNPKSSIGRIDLFVRLIADRNPQFDELPPGYRGRLYLEVVPQSFLVAVSPGMSFNQLRFRKARATPMDEGKLRKAHGSHGLLFSRGGQKLAAEGLRIESSGVILGVDLERDRVGFRAKKNASVVLDLSKVGSYRAEDFWEVVDRPASGELILEPGEFYLLSTQERVSVPPPLAAEIRSYDPTFGEHRSHYAGFFDPGFGYDPSGRESGSTPVLEVRTHSIPFRISHGQAICRIVFEEMDELPEKVYGPSMRSTYTSSGPKISKFFQNVW